jgi:hypothetical protein
MREENLFRRLADFEVPVEAAVPANAVSNLVLTAMGALSDRSGLQFPVGPTLVATGRRGFTLRYCHMYSLNSLALRRHRLWRYPNDLELNASGSKKPGFLKPGGFPYPGVVPSAEIPPFKP